MANDAQEQQEHERDEYERDEYGRDESRPWSGFQRIRGVMQRQTDARSRLYRSAFQIFARTGTGKTRRKRRPGTTIARIALLVLFCIGFFLSVFPVGRASLRATISLPTLLMAAEPAPLTVLDEPVRHTRTTITSRDGPVYLDIYAPMTPAPPIPGSRGGVVMIPGIGDNRNVPQLINLSLALAHAGLVVVNMTTPTLISYNLTAQDSDGVVQAFNFLAHLPDVSAHKIGLIGFSGGGPIICFAAADPRIRDQVAFVALFGSYFNATSLLTAVARRALTVNGQVQPWRPDPFPIQVLANVISATLPPSEGLALQSAFTPRGKPLSAHDLAQFSPGSVAAYHLLAGDQPGRVDANLAALPQEAHTLLDTLSVNRVLDQMRAPIYLLHDRNDTSVPFTESLDFATALMRIHHPYDLAEFGIFQHVQVRADLGISQLLSDSPRLFHILSLVMLPSSYPEQGQVLPLHLDVGAGLAPALSLNMLVLSLCWLLLGALIGALAHRATLRPVTADHPPDGRAQTLRARRTDQDMPPVLCWRRCCRRRKKRACLSDRWRAHHRRWGWLLMLAVGALAALLGGWLGVLLLGKYIATAAALWVAVLGVFGADGRKVTSLLRTWFGSKGRN